MMVMQAFCRLLAFGGATFLFGCNNATLGTPWTDPAVVERGRAIYNFRCYFCHGYSGDAKTLAATFLTPAPRNFVEAPHDSLTYPQIVTAVQQGRPGSAMKSFKGVITDDEIASVSAFVFDEFVIRKARNTRYHTPENGWPNHDKYASAFPFAKGEIALTAEVTTLSSEQQAGRRLFLSSCISCHDRGAPTQESLVWDSRPLSYPRFNYDHRKPEVDAATSATPYRLHDILPVLQRPNRQVLAGQSLFQANCAFCHAADGTGKNWIGSFLEPHPRNLTDPAFMKTMTRARMREVIRHGLPETSMPAWKDVLDETQIDAVISYVDAAFHPLPN